ncbi:MAG: thioredoxin domain-containing protein [Acidobacteria bacterium]|nr:thioredoxin domain-containing protein [Acidobacteriota bacterium]
MFARWRRRAAWLKAALDLLSTMLVIVASAYLMWSLAQSRSARSAEVAGAVSGLIIPADELRHVRGSGSIALIEFTDYQCPFCATYARETAPLFFEHFVKAGLVRQVVFNFPLEGIHPRARRASAKADKDSLGG